MSRAVPANGGIAFDQGFTLADNPFGDDRPQARRGWVEQYQIMSVQRTGHRSEQ